MLLAIAAATWANTGDEPRDYSFMVVSPGNKCYAVQALKSWSTNSFSVNVRFRMYDQSSDKVLWETTRCYSADPSSVRISDDGEYVIVLDSFSSSHGWSTGPSTKKTLPPPDVQRKILDNKVIQFFHRDQLIKEYALADLRIPVESMQFYGDGGVSFFSPDDATRHWPWTGGAPTNEFTGNPAFIDAAMLLVTADKRILIFNFVTGDLLKAVPTAEHYLKGEVLDLPTDYPTRQGGWVKYVRTLLEPREAQNPKPHPTTGRTVPPEAGASGVQ